MGADLRPDAELCVRVVTPKSLCLNADLDRARIIELIISDHYIEAP